MHVAICIVLAAVAAPADEATLKLLTQFRSEFVAISPINSARPPVAISGAGDKQKHLFLFQDFAIERYETTQDLYEAVIGANPSRWKGARNSVEMTSLADAKTFCEKATTLLREAKLIDADQVVRLPTESEWEYCCRAGTTTAYSFGDDESALDDYGWFTGNAAGNDPPVGALKPNPWGLYDMHGYLDEWALADGAANERSPTAAVRGGSWKSPAKDCSSTSVRHLAVATKDDAVGFRCVLTKAAKSKND